MTKTEFKNVFAGLDIEYNHELKHLSDEQLTAKKRLWYDEFEHVDYQTFENAIKQIIRTNKFFPKISEIYEILQENELPRLDPEMEFQKAITIIKNNPIRTLSYTCPETGKFRDHVTTLDDVLNKLDLTTAQAVRSIGIHRMLNLDDRVWVRKEFIESLEESRRVEVRNVTRDGLKTSTLIRLANLSEEERNFGPMSIKKTQKRE